MEVLIPTREGTIFEGDKGQPRTCPDISNGWYTQSNLAVASIGTVRMPMRGTRWGHIGATWRIRLYRSCAAARCGLISN